MQHEPWCFSELSPRILLCLRSNQRSPAVCWLLIGREGGRCDGHGEQTRDFSNHPTNVINILKFLSCIDSICSVSPLDYSLWSLVGFSVFVFCFVCFGGSFDVMSGPSRGFVGEVTPQKCSQLGVTIYNTGRAITEGK